jgi:hypothetical protein
MLPGQPQQLQQGNAAEPRSAEGGALGTTNGVPAPTAAAAPVPAPEVAATAGGGTQEQGQQHHHQHGTSTNDPAAEPDAPAAAGADMGTAEQQEGSAAAAFGAVNKANKAKINSFQGHAERMAAATTLSYQPLQHHPRVMEGVETVALTLTVLPTYPSNQKGGPSFQLGMHGCDSFTPEDQRLVKDMLTTTASFVRSCMVRQQVRFWH